ncbi:MerR family transcriptional regulator [Palleronia caenipelagi]|uniref:MerR family transcriptional regulator n=1 Tax=Palleronia caenipelagi TaxID=2489174 RepID=A0A547Q6T2_9RHOB|nr:MerR family transcriptional regulator [Palleronia caenipelagi]TRD22092.1 MerR family transcriptional regulator [Palleronia caenipelagi]
MNVKLTDWDVGARTAADILGVPVETFRTWRKRHGLVPTPEWPGRGRAPEMRFQFRDLLQARVAQKLMSVGVSVKDACAAAHHGNFNTFISGGQVRVGFVDGELCVPGKPGRGPNEYEDVFLTFSLENDGWRIARQFKEDLADEYGEEVATAAYDDFVKYVEKIRSRSRVDV